MIHDIKVNTYNTHSTDTLPMTDHMGKVKEHQAARRYLEVLNDYSL